MQPVDDIGIAIADVYAKALLKLAGDAGVAAPVLEELGGLIVYVNSTPEFESFLISQTLDGEARRAMLEKAMRGKTSDLLLNFLHVLNAKDRMPLLEQVYVQYRLAYEAAQNQIEVTVTTATQLTANTRVALLAALRKYLGKDPILTEAVDESIIGGLVVHVGDEKIDQSVSWQLRGFRERFQARASQEIHSGREYFHDV